MIRLPPSLIVLTREDISLALSNLETANQRPTIVTHPGVSKFNTGSRRVRQRAPSSPKISGDLDPSIGRSPRFSFQSPTSESSEEEDQITEWNVTSRRVPFRTLSYDSVANRSDSTYSEQQLERDASGSEQDDRLSVNRPRIVSRPSRLNSVVVQVQTRGREENVQGFDDDNDSDGDGGDEGSVDGDGTVAATFQDNHDTSDLELGHDPIFDSDGYLENASGNSSVSGGNHITNQEVEPSDDESDRGRASNSSGHSTRRLASIFRRRHIPHSRHTVQYGTRNSTRSSNRRLSESSSGGSVLVVSTEDSDTVTSPVTITRVQTNTGESEGIAASSLADSIELQRMRYGPLLHPPTRDESVQDFSDSSSSRPPDTRPPSSVRRVASHDEISPMARSNHSSRTPPRRNSHCPSSPTANSSSQIRLPTIANFTLPSLSSPSNSESTPASASHSSRAQTASWFRWARNFSRRVSRDDDHHTEASPRRNSTTNTNDEDRIGGHQADGVNDRQSPYRPGPSFSIRHATPVELLQPDDRDPHDTQFFTQRSPETTIHSRGGNSGAPIITSASTSNLTGGRYHTRSRGNRG